MANDVKDHESHIASVHAIGRGQRGAHVADRVEHGAVDAAFVEVLPLAGAEGEDLAGGAEAIDHLIVIDSGTAHGDKFVEGDEAVAVQVSGGVFTGIGGNGGVLLGLLVGPAGEVNLLLIEHGPAGADQASAREAARVVGQTAEGGLIGWGGRFLSGSQLRPADGRGGGGNQGAAGLRGGGAARTCPCHKHAARDYARVGEKFRHRSPHPYRSHGISESRAMVGPRTRLSRCCPPLGRCRAL